MTYKRSPAGNVLLFVVTLGVYWFVWLYNAFRELADDRRERLRVYPWVGTLVLLHLGHVALGGTYLAKVIIAFSRTQSLPEPRPPLDPVSMAIAILVVAFYLVQFEFLLRGDRILRRATTAEHLPRPPPAELVFGLNVLLAVSVLPGFLAPGYSWMGAAVSMAGLILATVWVLLFQNCLNQYWDARMLGARLGQGPAPLPIEPSFAPPKL